MMRRSQSSDHSISLNIREQQPVRLVKSRSEAVLNPNMPNRNAEHLSPINSYDHDEEDEIHDEEDEEQYEVHFTLFLE